MFPPERRAGHYRPSVSLIAAVAANGVIGAGNAMPWHLPADLRHFKSVTMGRPVIMGRRTFESIGRALPGRTNIVVTRRSRHEAPGCVVVGSLEAAYSAAGAVDEVFVIGGGELYREAMPHADRLYITEIRAAFDGDTHFPAIDPQRWREVAREVHADGAPFRFDFVRYELAPA
jgi:dihydrofolate reductase